MPDVITVHAAYMEHAFSNHDAMVSQAKAILAGIDYDTMVGTGLSGALVVPTIARALGKHWMIVRKDNDGSHSFRRAEGTLGARWVFVDDLIDQGLTYGRVVKTIRKVAELEDHQTEHVGAYLYQNYGAPEYLPYVEGEYLYRRLRSWDAHQFANPCAAKIAGEIA